MSLPSSATYESKAVELLEVSLKLREVNGWEVETYALAIEDILPILKGTVRKLRASDALSSEVPHASQHPSVLEESYEEDAKELAKDCCWAETIPGPKSGEGLWKRRTL